MIVYLNKSLFHTRKTASPESRKKRTQYATKKPDEIFFKFGATYFDGGEGSLSYGAYTYDGRYKEAVENVIKKFNIKESDEILELGCAKGYLLYEFFKLGYYNVSGVDVSEYAILSAKEELKNKLKIGSVTEMDALLEKNKKYEFIFSKEMLPHLSSEELNNFFEYLPKIINSKSSLYFEIQTAKDSKGLESIRAYDPTHKSLMTPDAWKELLSEKLLGVEANIEIFLKELF